MPEVTTRSSTSREVVISSIRAPPLLLGRERERQPLPAGGHRLPLLFFSGKATLYDFPVVVPIPETAPIAPTNPCRHTKAAVKQMLSDLHASAPDAWRIACLRYFNPVGAHPSGCIRENPLGMPNNLFPFVSQVAVGRRAKLQVFGDDWPTPDGTGVRDYIHVMDLAEGHRAALDCLLAEEPQRLTLNLGSGQGQSVLEVVQAMEAASGHSIPYAITDRRPGDAAISVADPTKARSLRCRSGTGSLRRLGNIPAT